MHQMFAIIIFGLVCFLHLMKGTDGWLMETPESNKTATVGSEVILNCSSNLTFDILSWQFIPSPTGSSNPVEVTIITIGNCTNGTQLYSTNPPYHLETDLNDYTCNLNISNVTYAQAGIYVCTSLESPTGPTNASTLLLVVCNQLESEGACSPPPLNELSLILGLSLGLYIPLLILSIITIMCFCWDSCPGYSLCYDDTYAEPASHANPAYNGETSFAPPFYEIPSTTGAVYYKPSSNKNNDYPPPYSGGIGVEADYEDLRMPTADGRVNVKGGGGRSVDYRMQF